jgi:radical SAM/Cys-rich protein
MTRTLIGESHPLALVENQLRILRPDGKFKPFHRSLEERGLFPLRPSGLRVMQINVGRMCNQTCKHCHVDAGPDRKEIMTRETMELCLAALERSSFAVVDITGGAPEMNPSFCWLVEQVCRLGRHVIDRSNLTILLAPRYDHLPSFLAEHAVEIISSLPYYAAGTTDRQRGEGVFEKSIAALRRLNALGYGQPASNLKLNLVYNPCGAYLPPSQDELERTFKERLALEHGIVFNSLYCVTNQPINRFLEYLLRSGNYETYMERLIQAYNPHAAERVMCREMISVAWDGRLYDCDFNQMLDLALDGCSPKHIRDFQPERLENRCIVTGLHCYACTAGAGSSCTGATA